MLDNVLVSIARLSILGMLVLAAMLALGFIVLVFIHPALLVIFPLGVGLMFAFASKKE